MFVRLTEDSLSEDSFVLSDVDNFTQFHVEAGTASMTDVLRQLGSLAQACDDDHVWLNQAAIEELSGRKDDHDWSDGFAKMCAFAESKGWFNEAGTHLRAHLKKESTSD